MRKIRNRAKIVDRKSSLDGISVFGQDQSDVAIAIALVYKLRWIPEVLKVVFFLY